MADKTSMVITATNAVTGKAQQKTVTDINPQASSTHLLTWAQMTTGLTKDTYQKSERVDVIDLDNNPLQVRTPNISVLGTTYQFNGTPIRVGFSQLEWNSTQQFFGISISIPTGLTNNKQPTVNPTIINTTSTNPNVTFKVSSLTWYRNNINKWYFTSGVTGANSSDKQETTLTFQIQIPQGDGYEAYLSPVITIEVYDDTEG